MFLHCKSFKTIRNEDLSSQIYIFNFYYPNWLKSAFQYRSKAQQTEKGRSEHHRGVADLQVLYSIIEGYKTALQS